VRGEVDAFGVFMPIALVTGASAFVALFVFRRLLRTVNAYAFVWHAGLFDVAMFVVLWWFFAWVAGTPTT
jgi:protein AaeX